MVRTSRNTAFAALSLSLMLPSWASAQLHVSIPEESSLVFGSNLNLEINDCPATFGNPNFSIHLDGQELTQRPLKGPYPGQWLLPLTLSPGNHLIQATERPEMLRILTKLAEGLKAYPLPNGLWDTVINAPGYAYEETSGSSLVAYAIAKAVYRGWLAPEYLPIAHHAFQAVTAMLQVSNYGLSMPGISSPTNPGIRLAYKLIPRQLNAPYGVGAYLMAASELKDEEF